METNNIIIKILKYKTLLDVKKVIGSFYQVNVINIHGLLYDEYNNEYSYVVSYIIPGKMLELLTYTMTISKEDREYNNVFDSIKKLYEVNQL